MLLMVSIPLALLLTGCGNTNSNNNNSSSSSQSSQQAATPTDFQHAANKVQRKNSSLASSIKYVSNDNNTEAHYAITLSPHVDKIMKAGGKDAVKAQKQLKATSMTGTQKPKITATDKQAIQYSNDMTHLGDDLKFAAEQYGDGPSAPTGTYVFTNLPSNMQNGITSDDFKYVNE